MKYSAFYEGLLIIIEKNFISKLVNMETNKVN